MLDTSLYTKGCKDEAELAVCLMLLDKVPAEKELNFDILYNAADRMDENDVLTPVDKIAIALVNCTDDDVITVSKAQWVKEMKSRFFDLGGPGEDLSIDNMQYFDCAQIVADLESEYSNECNYDWSDFHDEDDQPATLYDYLKAHGERMNFAEDDLEQYALKLVCDGRVCGVEDYFMEEEYAESFFKIGGSQVFGPEVYEKDGVVLTTPNFNYDLAAPLCLACEELVYATRDGEGISEHRAEVEDQLAMMGFEVEPTMDEAKRQRLDDLIKAADEFFTYPEGFEAPNKSRNTEAR